MRPKSGGEYRRCWLLFPPPPRPSWVWLTRQETTSRESANPSPTALSGLRFSSSGQVGSFSKTASLVKTMHSHMPKYEFHGCFLQYKASLLTVNLVR